MTVLLQTRRTGKATHMARDDPSASRMKRKAYEKELRKLQVQLCHLQEFVKEKKLKVIVTETLPLSEGQKAQEQVGTHHTRGKIVLKVADAPK